MYKYYSTVETVRAAYGVYFISFIVFIYIKYMFGVDTKTYSHADTHTNTFKVQFLRGDVEIYRIEMVKNEKKKNKNNKSNRKKERSAKQRNVAIRLGGQISLMMQYRTLPQEFSISMMEK